MTDAAGSFTVEDAKSLGVTLLNSYLIVDEQSFAETLYQPERLYLAMTQGSRISTAQASTFERHQSYLSATRLYDKVLYLCVGSVYTGNHEVAAAWRKQQAQQDRFDIIDTGAASGRLGIIALAVARLARKNANPQTVLEFAHTVVAQSQEFVFLDQLKYLAAGGRISKTKGFFGDLLHMKPIVSPLAEGATKVGVVRNREDQLNFAIERLDRNLRSAAFPMIMVQYSDNRPWVETTAAAAIRARYPSAEILVRPLSLTSGAHMGPGTWAMAFLPTPEPGQSDTPNPTHG
jgi:DegV family protein with EDD domain